MKAILTIAAFLWLLLLNFSALAQTPNLETKLGGRWEMYNDKGEFFDQLANATGWKDRWRLIMAVDTFACAEVGENAPQSQP